jgi:MFS transporter, OFA family, oxalate/formate antiporter
MSTEASPAPANFRSKVIMVVIAAVIFEFCLGTFYAWSVFAKPLMGLHHWDKTQVTWPMGLCAFFTGLWAFLIGTKADRYPKAVGAIGALLWGVGLLLGGYGAQHGNLLLLSLGYGVIGGSGIGLGYITGIAVALKWVPHRRGFISGLVIMSFGAGGMIVSKLAPALIIKHGPGLVLCGMGVLFLIVGMVSGLVLTNPPGFKPKDQPSGILSLIPTEVLGTWSFWALWIMVFINVYAGFAIISQASPMAQDLAGLTPAGAGTLVMVMLLGNGLGRIIWSSLSDKIGRRPTLVLIFSTLVVIFALLVHIHNAWLLGAFFTYIVLCYGGIFGTMPAFTADIFGTGQMGRVYGPVLTAIAAGGLLGPIIYSKLRESTGGYTIPLYIIAGALVLAAILPFTVGKGEHQIEKK